MAAGDRIAYYKTLKLGDFIRGHEDINLEGEAPEIKTVVSGNTAVIVERGGNSRLEIEAVATLKLNTSETDADFMWRKLAFGNGIAVVRGIWPITDYTNAGILAVLGSDAASEPALKTSVNAESPGSNVDIELTQTGTYIVASGEKWFITDGLQYEILSGVAGTYSDKIKVATVVNSYLAGAVLFRPTYFVRGCYLLPGVKLSGNESEAFESVREIRLKFVSIEAAER